MGVTPAHSFVQINTTDLTAFDDNAGFFGSLGQGIERPLGRALLVPGNHRPIGLCREVSWWCLRGQGKDAAALLLR
jgi:hypothetical protein